MGKLIILLIFLLFSLSLSSAFAGDFSVDGYDISLSASQSRGVIDLSGRINGPRCKNLRLDIFLHNENGDRESTVITIKDVSGAGSNLIEGKIKLYHATNENWEISSVYTRCLSEN